MRALPRIARGGRTRDGRPGSGARTPRDCVRRTGYRDDHETTKVETRKRGTARRKPRDRSNADRERPDGGRESGRPRPANRPRGTGSPSACASHRTHDRTARGVHRTAPTGRGSRALKSRTARTALRAALCSIPQLERAPPERGRPPRRPPARPRQTRGRPAAQCAVAGPPVAQPGTSLA